jgi:hypothetical protein
MEFFRNSVRRLLTLSGSLFVIFFCGAVSVAFASLTFTSTTIIAGNSSLSIDASTTISIGTSTASAVTIGNGSSVVSLFGKVGIGTSSPSAELEVYGSTPGSSGLKLDGLLAGTTSTSTTGKVLSVDSAGNVVLADASTPAAGGQLIYDKSYWSDLSDFTVQGNTPGIVNGAIELNPSFPDTFNAQNLTLNKFISNDEDVDFEVTVKVAALPSGSYGIGLGRMSTNGWFQESLSVQLDTSKTPDVMDIWPEASGIPVGDTLAGSKDFNAPPVAVGDVVTLIYSQRENTVTVSVNDITQDTFDSYTLTNGLVMPNTSQFRIFGFGGTFDIQNVRLISRQVVAPKVVFIGDSKTIAGASWDGIRFASLVPSLGPVDVFAGDGDRTAEILQGINYIASLKPQYAILNIGRNDLASGVPTATWEANYEAIVDTLKAAGVTVIHLLPIPELVVPNQSVLTNFINSTYPSDGKIDVSGMWNNSVDLSSDNIHPNPDGMRLIANAILTSGLIPTGGNSVIPDTAPYLFSQTVSPSQSPWVMSGSSIYNLNDNVGIGTIMPLASLQIATVSSTILIGGSAASGCLEMGNSDGSAGINYITVLNGVLTATTTKPSNCQ